jgi:hypothetical protein
MTRILFHAGYRTCGRLRHQPEGSPLRQTESGSLVFGTAGPPRAALHPVSRRRSCLRRLSRCSSRDDSDFHLLISCMCVRTGCGVSPQMVVRASRPDLECGRRDASPTVWSETLQPPLPLGNSQQNFVRGSIINKSYPWISRLGRTASGDHGTMNFTSAAHDINSRSI